MSISRDTLLATLDGWLKPAEFSDYSPNGLQVEGTPEIAKVVTGVTASQALIDAAIERGADTVIVHHGYFWKGEDPTVTGMKQRRLRALLANNINLIAYHLPLDAHSTLGNNVGLGKAIGMGDLTPVDSQSPTGILYQGTVAEQSLQDFAKAVAAAVGRELVACVEGGYHAVRKVAVCTGGGQGFIDAACDAGVDAFISGEISEQTVHVARERGIHYLAAGHHATERFGPQALGSALAEAFTLDVEFVDIDSPA